MAKKADDMQTELSYIGNGHAVPTESLDRRLDRYLTQLYDDLLAEPLSPALATLMSRLGAIRSNG
ncbi:MAG: hypothetical protein WEC00_04530 [Dongiaceae bacterium]